MAISERMNRYSSEDKKALEKANNLKSNLKKTREKLTIEKATCKASDEAVAKSKLKAAQEKLHKALQDLAEL